METASTSGINIITLNIPITFIDAKHFSLSSGQSKFVNTRCLFKKKTTKNGRSNKG